MAGLQGAYDVINQIVSGIKAGVGAAPSIAGFAANARTEIAADLRKKVLDTNAVAISRAGRFELVREYARCDLLQRAKRTYETQIRSLIAELEGAVGNAQWLLNHRTEIDTALASYQSMLTRLEDAMEQVPLGFWLRRRFGLPTWGWAALGGVAFVGGAFTLRRMRKKSRAAAPVAKNRRRSRQRRRRMQ
jgi:hypothetical protein